MKWQSRWECNFFGEVFAKFETAVLFNMSGCTVMYDHFFMLIFGKRVNTVQIQQNER